MPISTGVRLVRRSDSPRACIASATSSTLFPTKDGMRIGVMWMFCCLPEVDDATRSNTDHTLFDWAMCETDRL